MIILGTNSIKETGFDVANSARWNRADSAYMDRTFSSSGNRDKWTYSLWVKKCKNGVEQRLLTTSDNSSFDDNIRFESDDKIMIICNNTETLKTNRVFRDPSAWYHICVIWDSGNGTSGDRCQLWINGIRETSFGTESYPSQNQDSFINNNTRHYIGVTNVTANSHFLDGYLSEVVFQNDSADSPVDKFGSFDEDSGIFKPIDVSDLTFGTNGFYLDFEDSSALGNDVSGNNNDFSLTNFAATDQTTDTCTNNFATINPLDNYFAQATLSEGNTKVATNASAEAMSTSTFAMTKGRWYFEVDFISNSGSVSRQCGITPTPSYQSSSFGKAGDVTPHTHAYSDSGNLQTGDGSGGQTALATLSSFTNGDIIGIYMDLEDMKSYWSKNGTLMNSGTGIDLTALASNGTGHYMFYVGDNNTAAQTCEANFGNGFQSLSSAVTDDNGYGAFEYSPNITGDGTAKSFYSCCTKNLAEYG